MPPTEQRYKAALNELDVSSGFAVNAVMTAVRAKVRPTAVKVAAVDEPIANWRT
jgi:hypothetical protein